MRRGRRQTAVTMATNLVICQVLADGTDADSLPLVAGESGREGLL